MVVDTVTVLVFTLITFAGPLVAIWLVWSIHRIRVALEDIAREMRSSNRARSAL